MNYSHKQLITQYRKLHRNNKKYGRSSEKLKSYFQKYVNQLNPSSILDYGCGKSKLLNKLDVNASLYKYDPAIPEYASKPAGPFDLI